MSDIMQRLEKKPTINSWKRHALCDSVLSYERNRWKFEHVLGIGIPFGRNNSDGKASLKRQKSPETTTDTLDVSNFYWFYV